MANEVPDLLDKDLLDNDEHIYNLLSRKLYYLDKKMFDDFNQMRASFTENINSSYYISLKRACSCKICGNLLT